MGAIYLKIVVKGSRDHLKDVASAFCGLDVDFTVKDNTLTTAHFAETFTGEHYLMVLKKDFPNVTATAKY